MDLYDENIMSYEASMFISSLLTVRAASARILILRIMSTIVNTTEQSESLQRWTTPGALHRGTYPLYLQTIGNILSHANQDSKQDYKLRFRFFEYLNIILMFFLK